MGHLILVKSLGKAIAEKYARVKAEFERCEENGIYQQRANSYPNTNNKFQLLKNSPFFFSSFPSVKWEALRKIIWVSPFYLLSQKRNLILGSIFMFDNLLRNLLLTSDRKSSPLLCVKQGCPYLLIFKFVSRCHP